VHRGGKVSDDEDYHNVVAAAQPISNLLQARLLPIVRVLPNSVFLIWTSTVLVVDQPEQEEMKDDNDGGNAEPEKRMKTSQSGTSSV